MNILLAAFIMLLCREQNVGPHLSFIDNRIVNCEEVKMGEIVKVSVGFKNDGYADLLITDYDRTCNCTDVEYPKAAVHPGENAEVKITVDTAGKIGNQIIVIKLYLNSDQKYSIIRLNIPVSHS